MQIYSNRIQEMSIMGPHVQGKQSALNFMIKSLKLKFHMLISTLLITKLSLGVPAMSL